MQDRGYELGIAFGGGAARGLFHIGVIRALAEAGIHADCIAGSSAGAVMGTLAAARVAPEVILEITRDVSWGEHVFDFKRTVLNRATAFADMLARRTSRVPPGLLEGSRIAALINGLIGGRRFSGVAPLIVTGCDAVTGEKLLFCSPEVARRFPTGRLVPRTAWEHSYRSPDVVVPFEDVGLAVRASACFPGVFTSVPIDCPDLAGGVAPRLVIDGGICEQVPTRVLRQAGCRKVLAVMIGFLPWVRGELPTWAIPINSGQFLSRPMIAQSLELADHVIYDPGIEEVSMLRFDAGLVERGYAFTREQLPAIRRALDLPAPRDVTILSEGQV